MPHTPLPIAHRSSPHPPPQAELRAAGLNPRGGQPYKRGEYNKAKADTAGPAEMLKAAAAAKKAAEKKESDKEAIGALRTSVATLEEQLKAAAATTALAVEKAKLDATASMHGDLLQRYRDGLRDGASLARGRSGASNSLGSDSPVSLSF